MEVKVLGSGCERCRRLCVEVEKAIAEQGVAATLVKVDRIVEILAHGVTSAPALVVNGEVKSAGRVPSAAEIAGWLRAAAKQ